MDKSVIIQAWRNVKMDKKTIKDIEVAGKTVLVRVTSTYLETKKQEKLLMTTELLPLYQL